MTDNGLAALKQWIADMALLIEKNEELPPSYFANFLQEPELGIRLIELVDALDENQVEAERAYYSACVFAMDICVAELQAASETGNKRAGQALNKFMSSLATCINQNNHTLSFWLPILNAFYEVHVELIPELKSAYFELANQDGELLPEEELDHLDSMRELIEDLSDMSVFDMAENFFAQSYAMPPEFFAELVFDLYSLEEGKDIAVLTLLHPKQDVRDVVVAVHEQLLAEVTLSPISLARLEQIKHWYPSTYQDQFNRWIKWQRKKTGIFQLQSITNQGKVNLIINATEVDGTGAQGIFIHIKGKGKNRLSGLLFKQGVGIKDAWITPIISARDVSRYYVEAFDDSVMLQEVDVAYLNMMTNHFLALSIERGAMPDLHLLEMQELLNLQWSPQRLDVDDIMDHLAIQISPFTPDSVQESLKRSKRWPKNKRFTESWYIEDGQIDKLVNRHCTFIEGVKVCRFEEAIQSVFAQLLETNRSWWLFHFLWLALWIKAKAAKNEKIWKDSFIIAHTIHAGMPLASIPIMYEVCRQSVINSVETMEERRTYLSKE